MGPTFTYLCCQLHICFLEVTGVDVKFCKVWHHFQLVFILRFVLLLVVIKVEFVCASLKEETHEFR